MRRIFKILWEALTYDYGHEPDYRHDDYPEDDIFSDGDEKYF